MITHEALAAGFTRLLAAVDDLVLDVPDAVHLMSLFLGRAVVDEQLPPAFLAQVGLMSMRSGMRECVEQCESIVRVSATGNTCRRLRVAGI